MTDNALMTWESEGGYAPPDPDTFADTADAVGALVPTDTRAREAWWSMMLEAER